MSTFPITQPGHHRRLPPMSDAWVWTPSQGVYYHAQSNTYAIPNASSEWVYLSAAEMASRATTTPSNEVEDGEIEEDVGWGGLMEPEELAAIVDPSSSKASTSKPRTSTNSPAPSRNPAYDPPPDPEHQSPPTVDHLLRLVVKRSKALPLGAVAVLDSRPGGIKLGRDRAPRGDTRVRVKEMEVSKTHALVYFGSSGREPRHGRDVAPEPEGWWVLDLGSTLGTYLAHRGEERPTRLSEGKCASPPFAMQHGDVLTVGTTTFGVHIHEDWPCEACQVGGNVQIALDDGVEEVVEVEEPRGAMKKGQRQVERKIAMARLRDELLGEEGRGGKRGGEGEGYVDRSAQRRRLHPPSPPRAGSNSVPVGSRGGGRTWGGGGASLSGNGVVSAGPTPGPSAVSQAMLAKQGWAPGQGLGKDGAGRAQALEPTLRAERAGLGARGEVADAGGGDWKTRGKQRRWGEVQGP